MKPMLTQESKKAAREIIRKAIDCEGKYLATSLYLMEGRKLRDFLAYAYTLGVEDAQKGVTHGKSR